MNTEFEKQNIFSIGSENSAFAQYFVGKSYLNPLVEPGKSPIFLANVTFEPGCRNNWHIHRASGGGGQILICVAGSGWYQEDGKPARSLGPGDVVVIPPQRETLAWSQSGYLVQPYCAGGSRNRYFQ